MTTVAVANWIRALVSNAEGWVFESQPRQTLSLTLVKTGCDSSIAKCSAIGAIVTGPRRRPL